MQYSATGFFPMGRKPVDFCGSVEIREEGGLQAIIHEPHGKHQAIGYVAHNCKKSAIALCILPDNFLPGGALMILKKDTVHVEGRYFGAYAAPLTPDLVGLVSSANLTYEGIMEGYALVCGKQKTAQRMKLKLTPS